MAEQAETAGEWSGLKIIGAGYGRTGTLTTKTALEELGFGPCYHMTELFQNASAEEQWEAVIRGEPVRWDAIFTGYQASVDWPACAFYQELMRAYPDARVLLTVRDPERWYESVKSTIYRAPDNVPADNSHARMISTLIWQGTFNGKFEDKDYALGIFNQHNEEVRHYVPPEKLLVYDVKEGWEPLCTFLGVAVPDKPFPHLNDRDSFNEMRNRRVQEIQGQADSFFPEKR